MGYLAPGEMFDNMLQLMRFSVYLEGILNINNGYFYIKIMISAAHMVGDSWACFLRKYFEKKCNLVRFDVSLHTMLGPCRPVPLHAICGPTQVHFLAYYMGAPSDHFLRIEYGGPVRSVSSLIMEASLCLFFAHYIGPLRSVSLITILGPSAHILRLLYGGPSDQFLLIQYGGPSQINFFAYDMPPPLRSVPSHATGGPPPVSFFTKYMGSPQISFSAYYMGPPQVSFFVYYMGPTQISFCAYFLGPLSDQFFLLLYGACLDQFLCILFRVPSQISFFAYYMGPLRSFVLHSKCKWGPLKSVSLHTIWGPLRSVFHLLYGAPSG